MENDESLFMPELLNLSGQRTLVLGTPKTKNREKYDSEKGKAQAKANATPCRKEGIQRLQTPELARPLTHHRRVYSTTMTSTGPIPSA